MSATAAAASSGARAWVGSRWVKVVLSAVLLTLLLRRTDLSDVATTVAQAQFEWVLLAFVGYIASMVVSSIRWTMLARPLGFTEPYRLFFGSYFSGVYMNLFAPSTVAGDIGRALYLAGPRKRKTLAFTTVLADRVLGFIVLCWIGALSILLQPSYGVPRFLYLSAWVIPPATLLAWLYLPQVVRRVCAPEHRLRRLVEHDLAPYWNDSRLLMETSAVAAIFHTIQIGTQVLLAWALGLRIPSSFFFIFVPVVNILGMLPISFSGVGVREAGYFYFLARIGVHRPDAVALGLLSSAVVLATGIVSGLVFVLWRRQPVDGRVRREKPRRVGE